MASKDDKSGLIDIVRNMAISRRGGVRTRGGRLPPISIRDISQATSKKKVIAPKVPQRRVVVKKERTAFEDQVPLIKTEPRGGSQDRRGRGRGAKILVQTEGNFLAHGPAAKVKREPNNESISYPRPSKSSIRERKDVKLDPDCIEGLLQSYEDNEFDEDDLGAKPPYRLPLLKKNFVPSIKKEEPSDEDDIKAEIKSETCGEQEKWNSLEGKFLTRIKKEPSPEGETVIEDFKGMEGEGTMILLKLPSCLPFATEPTEAEASKDSNKKVSNKDGEKESKPKVYSTVKSLPQGFVGKLQVMKSGKKRLVLGSTEFEITDVLDSESLNEVASIRMDKDGGDMTVLGKIDKTWVVRPTMKEGMYEGKEDLNFTK